MTLSDYAIETGGLSPHLTEDGSFSLYSNRFQERFHSSAGALHEANSKFVLPAQLERFAPSQRVRVLDVCFGLGYNTAAMLVALPFAPGPALECWGLELDHRPLKLALTEPGFKSLWPDDVLSALTDILNHGCWQAPQHRRSFQMLWGDARQQIRTLQSDLQFDLIFLDAFSPGKCPQLWTEQFLHHLADLLVPGGRLLTYCRAAAVRNSLCHAGLELRSLLPIPGVGKAWSSGTMACCPEPVHSLPETGPGWRTLSVMEQEHLETLAGVPYRDPTGRDDSVLIFKRREKEQALSNRPSTSAWQRKWKLVR